MRKNHIVSKTRFAAFILIIVLLITAGAVSLVRPSVVSGTSEPGFRHVTVQYGDTIWGLAEEYCPATIDIRQAVYDICSINDVSADTLKAGQEIMIPLYN